MIGASARISLIIISGDEENPTVIKELIK